MSQSHKDIKHVAGPPPVEVRPNPEVCPPKPDLVKVNCAENAVGSSRFDASDALAEPECTEYTEYLTDPVVESVYRMMVLSKSAGRAALPAGATTKTEGWKVQMGMPTSSLTLPFPRAPFDFKRRLRSKLITLTYLGKPAATNDPNADEMIVHLSAEVCRTRFFHTGCGSNGRCAHRMVPLQFALMGYRMEGTPAQSVSLQCFTDDYTVYAPPTVTGADTAATVATTRPVRSWFDTPILRCESEKDAKDPSRVIQRQLPPSSCVMEHATHVPAMSHNAGGNNTPLRVLYRAPPSHANANHYVLIEALSSRSNRGLGSAQFYRDARPDGGSASAATAVDDSDMVYVAQPNALSQCPDPVSYLYTRSLPQSENGLNLEAIEQRTKTLSGQKGTFWVAHRPRLIQVLSEAGEEITRMRMVMNLDSGMNLQIMPDNRDTWKPVTAFRISFTLRMRYLVINA